jgi:Zn-dependent protease
MNYYQQLTGTTNMFKTLNFRIFKTDIKIHWSILLIMSTFIIPHIITGKYYEIIYGLEMFITLFTLVLIHEFGHVFASRHYGYITDTIYLHFFGGMAQSSSVWTKPKHTFIIAIAGPATNLCFFLIGLLFIDLNNLPDVNKIGNNFAVFFTLANFVMFTFNMLPIAPMDGGHVLTSICWKITKSLKLASFYAGFISIFLASALIPYFIYNKAYSPLLIMIVIIFFNISKIIEGFKIFKLMKYLKLSLKKHVEYAQDIKIKHINIDNKDQIILSYFDTKTKESTTLNFETNSLVGS